MSNQEQAVDARGRRRFFLSPWTLGIILSSVWFLFLLLYADLRYATNDDKSILRMFMGFQPGGPGSFSLFIHPLIAWPLYYLSLAFPGVAWFSILQLVFLWLANVVIVKSLLQCFMQEGKPLWMGLLFALCFLLILSLPADMRISFVETASLLGAASVAQLLSIGRGTMSAGKYLKRIALSIVLFMLATGMRSETAIPVLGYICIVLFWQALQRPGSGKPRIRRFKRVFISALLFGVTFVGLLSWRAFDIGLQGEESDVRWQQARSQVTDYLDLTALPEQLQSQAGWSAAQTDLLYEWYTMDAAFSTSAFQTVAQSAGDELRTGPRAAITGLMSRSMPLVYSILAVAALGVTCLLWLFLNWSRKQRAPLITLILAGSACAAMLCYLALEGRMIERAVMTPVFLTAVILFCLLPVCLPPTFHLRSLRGGVTLLCCLAVSAAMLASVVPTLVSVRHEPSKSDYSKYTAMDQLGIAHPDLLFIYGNRLVNDLRLFPDVSSGIPTNVTFWGGWERSTKEYRARLAAFGLDGENFTARDWLNPAVRYNSRHEKPDKMLLKYLYEQVDTKVEYESDKISEDLYVHRFFIPD
jgi:hypothetical protein